MSNNLRKCTTYNGTLCYFHTWTSKGAVKIHGELAVKDHCYSITMAIVEDIDTGQVMIVYPDELTFINDEGGQNA